MTSLMRLPASPHFRWLVSVQLMLLALVLMAGCESLGYGDVEIDTTRKSIVVATAEVRGANLLLQDLIARNAITAAQAQEAKDSLQESADILQQALTLVDANGDVLQAEDNVERARTTIRIALAILGPIAESNP